MSEMLYTEIREERGAIHISRDVIASIASIACQEVDGVAGMSAAVESDIKGVCISFDEHGVCTLEAHILVRLGAVVTETAQSVQLAVKNAVEANAGVEVAKVSVFVAGVTVK